MELIHYYGPISYNNKEINVGIEMNKKLQEENLIFFPQQ